MNKSDQHHCRCFAVDPRDVDACKRRLEERGFEPRPGGGEDRGQAFGLRFRLEELLQIHIKVMPDGVVEAGLEPPPEYLGANHDFRYSHSDHNYPAHDAIPSLLDIIGIEYTVIGTAPDSCRLPRTIEPGQTLKWWKILIVGVASLGLSTLLFDMFGARSGD